MNSVPITDIVKGDSFSLEGNLKTPMTGWKLRCEIHDDCSNSIKLATENSGGDDDQIEITDETNGIFIINVAKNVTTNFNDKSFIEVEAETNDDPTKIFTIHQGEIRFKKQEITWTEPE
jgi:hypothetical protein